MTTSMSTAGVHRGYLKKYGKSLILSYCVHFLAFIYWVMAGLICCLPNICAHCTIRCQGHHVYQYVLLFTILAVFSECIYPLYLFSCLNLCLAAFSIDVIACLCYLIFGHLESKTNKQKQYHAKNGTTNETTRNLIKHFISPWWASEASSLNILGMYLLSIHLVHRNGSNEIRMITFIEISKTNISSSRKEVAFEGSQSFSWQILTASGAILWSALSQSWYSYFYPREVISF